MSHSLNEENSILKSDLNIQAFFYFENNNEKEYQEFITPAAATRPWMNEPHIKYIYNCQPVVASNQIGWLMLQTHDIELEWNGGPLPEDMRLIKNENDLYANTSASHFGAGILSIAIPVIFQTPPGWGLLVGGPSNLFIDGLCPLEGLVETNWSPYPFTMNYKVTRKNHKIKIPKYHPICRIIPIPLNLNDKISMTYQNINKEEELNEHFKIWSEERRKKVGKRMFHYRDAVNVQGCPFLGVHKTLYKFKNILKNK